jgi:hypothetical protein
MTITMLSIISLIIMTLSIKPLSIFAPSITLHCKITLSITSNQYYVTYHNDSVIDIIARLII